MGLETGRIEMIAESNAGESKGTERSVVDSACNEKRDIAASIELLLGVMRACCMRLGEWMIDDDSSARLGA
jgi:hypothetical protein